MLLGRREEIAKLDRALARCRSGTGGVVLVYGEPGIGKTTVARELAEHVAESGALVFWGNCREEGGSPVHWPWVQVLRALAEKTEPARLADAMGGATRYLLAAIPEIAGRLPETARSAAPEPVPSRFAFFDAVETLLRNLSDEAPIVLVFDDLHAADASSLALCDFIAPGLAQSRTLLVATYREREAESGDAGATIASIGRLAERVRLGGLPRQALAELVRAVSGRAVPSRLVAAIHETTEGNPLFASEIARALGAASLDAASQESDRVRVPPTVEHILAARLAPLSSAARQTLSEAAVIGRSFDVALLRAMTQKHAIEILGHLDEAIASGIASMALGPRGEAAFAHGVYREFFYGSLSATRRAELHREAARALEERDADTELPAIVFHLLEAGPLGELGKAALYAERAGGRALERFAFADATGHFEDALRALGSGETQDVRRCDLWLRLAEARFRAGAGESGKQAYREAGEIALAKRDGTRLAHAGLGLAGPWTVLGGAVREDVVEVLRAALDHLDPANAALRARVLASLSIETYFAGDLERLDSMGREAVEVARSAADDRALAEALLARRITLRRGPKMLGERGQLSREALGLAQKLGDRELAFRARFCRIWDALQSGDADAFEDDLAATARTAAELRQPFYLWFVHVWHTVKALIEGRLADAERLVDEAFAIGQQAQGDDEAQQFAVQIYQAHVYFLRRDQGIGLGDLEPSVRAVAASIPLPLIRCFLAQLYCEVGRPNDARAELDRLAEGDFAAIRDDILWPICMTALAEVCADLEDRPRARILYDRLAPHATEHVTQGAYYNGSVAYYLGRLAATLDRVAAAEEHFKAAIDHHQMMGARCWLARTRLHYASLVLRSLRDARRGASLAEEALADARRLGMAKLVTDAERLVSLADAGAPPNPVAEAGQRVFRRDGDDWIVAFEGKAARLPSSKGLLYIARLLGDPGIPTPAIELAELDGATTARDSEKARLNVTRAIRAAIARIARHHRPLAEHLSGTITTGAKCSYDSKAPPAWVLR